ncbi:aromatic hydrocarbon degradation protein [Vibrio sp. S9_S30]|uniref:outer membrane protein transport protein n=1 Tax=Vibrio sp. S9_S30 TaxID=2720226 RepID=UPI0016817F58|nr:outer membrane protein transport protein [Vibrio sp. S9_S30]MBD1556080.1 aromatic hydrocarbon degradation protein [Vibrio sp. S9_S30]
MNTSRLFKKTVIATTIALASQQAIAAGFQLNAQSATGLGRAFAGDAVIADNASVMARNAAAMALFEETSMSLGVTTITSKIEIKDAKYTYANALTGLSTSESNYSNAGDTSIVPNLHIIVPLNEKIAVGANVYSNFGTKTQFDSTFVGAEYGGLTDVKSMNIGLSGSYRINEQLSVGAGLDMIYGSGKMQRNLSGKLTQVPVSISPILILDLSGLKVLDVDASGWALGFNLGTVYEIDKNNRFGLSYRSSPTLKAKGDVTTSEGVTKGDTLLIPLPDMAEFSGYHRIDGTEFALHYSVQWIGWSTFEKLEAEKTGILNEYKWQNGIHYSLGGTYFLSPNWTVRAGYMHDTSAQDKLTSISVPDSNRNWLSAGFTYNIDDQSNVDVGATYLLGQDVNVSEDNLPLSKIEGTTRADAILLGVQYSRTF